jgi:hypothetical protein
MHTEAYKTYTNTSHRKWDRGISGKKKGGGKERKKQKTRKL